MENEPTAESLYDRLEAAVPPPLAVPDAIRQLFVWIGENGVVADTGLEGVKCWLWNKDRFPEASSEDEWPYGTDIEFLIESDDYYASWFGSTNPEIRRRLCAFAKTGAEGSHAGLWFDDADEPKIVHLGSGSGSTFVGQIGEHPVDFLRLIAIGYDEICWDEHFSEPPRHRGGLVVKPDVAFQNWVKTTFAVTIPATADEIVPHPGHIDDDAPRDPFCRWVCKMAR